MSAQYDIVVTSLGNNSYQFSTTGLDGPDLVFYRFSDGFHLIGQKTTQTQNAEVVRSFKSASTYQIAAYVARKGGPLRLATSTFSVLSACNTCPLPYVGLPENHSIQLGYTWMPFSNTDGLLPLTDNTTSPLLTTPNIPWLFVITTLKPPIGATHAEVNLPPGMQFVGAIYKNKWGATLNNGSNDPLSSVYSVANKVHFTFNRPKDHEFNVYLLVKGLASIDETYEFTGNLYSGTVLQGSSTIAVQGALNPRDPNVITPEQKTICAGQTNAANLKYRVQFQNTGYAPAEHVGLRFKFQSANIINVASALSNPMPYSPAWAELDAAATEDAGNFDFLFIELTDINLPGLYQMPPPEKSSRTIGWVEFEVTPNDCLLESQGALVLDGVVTFKAGTNFMEDVSTNIVSQIIYPLGCTPDLDCTGGRSMLGKEPPSNVFASRCYPAVFQDYLNVDVPAGISDRETTIAVYDLMGKNWLNQTCSAGAETKAVLETSGLPDGMYVVYVGQAGQVAVHKTWKIR